MTMHYYHQLKQFEDILSGVKVQIGLKFRSIPLIRCKGTILKDSSIIADNVPLNLLLSEWQEQWKLSSVDSWNELIPDVGGLEMIKTLLILCVWKILKSGKEGLHFIFVW